MIIKHPTTTEYKNKQEQLLQQQQKKMSTCTQSPPSEATRWASVKSFINVGKKKTHIQKFLGKYRPPQGFLSVIQSHQEAFKRLLPTGECVWGVVVKYANGILTFHTHGVFQQVGFIFQ